MSKFKVGDYVRVKKFNKRPDGWNKKGEMDYLIGKAVKIDGICSGGKLLLITDKVRGLSCFLEPEEIESINETIVIYRKENQVIALDKVSGSKAIARCHPDDEFDFYIGAKLAFERLMGVSYGISVKEMRDKLFKYCIYFSKNCRDCDLGGRKCRCGRGGAHFRTKYIDGTYKMSDEEIRVAYKTIFGDKEKEEPKEEPKKEEPKEEPKDFAKAMYEIRSDLEKAGFTKQESMDFVIKLSLKALYPN